MAEAFAAIPLAYTPTSPLSIRPTTYKRNF